MRAVLDVNVLISGLLAPAGMPAALLRAWQEGRFELIVSPLLLAELERALAYPKLTRAIPPADAQQFVAWLADSAIRVDDPAAPPARRSEDPDDDYLLALAQAHNAVVVSGDRHLLDLAGELPIYAPAAFHALLAELDR